ncbi:MAG: metallophosphoesterase family protein [Gemmataceae bacterium]
MLLGLLTDIHEAITPLEEALDRFRRLKVDRVLHLGDICAMHERLELTCRILEQAGVRGVWGNHDFGLCRDIDEEIRQRFSPAILRYMQTLEPFLIEEDCRLSHCEPWLDPYSIEDLWYFERLPETPAELARSFGAVPQRVLFSGHVHRWYLANPDGKIAWDGTRPITLRGPQRYFLILNAVIEGWCATYDTSSQVFTPVQLRARGSRPGIYH